MSLLRTTLYPPAGCGESPAALYLTPLDFCYNGQDLFPNDPSWSGFDVLDTLGEDGFLHRSIFSSTDQSCENATDELMIDLNICVGPFGAPYPWGILEAMSSIEQLL